MLDLPLRVGLAHCGARQPIARIQLVKQPLALPNTQLDPVTSFQALGQCLAVPQIGLQPGFRRRFADQSADFLQLLCR